MVVVINKVVTDNDVVAGLDGQSRRNKNQDAAGVIVAVVVLDQGVAAVLDLDAGYISENLVVSHINVVAHAHVDGCVLNPRQDIVLDQAVLAELREDTVDARVDDPVIADHKVVAGLPHDAVPLVVDDFEILDQDTVTGVKEGIIQLFFSIKGGPFSFQDHTLHADVFLVNVNGLLVGAGVNTDQIAGLGLCHRCLDKFAVSHVNYRPGYRRLHADGCPGRVRFRRAAEVRWRRRRGALRFVHHSADPQARAE